MMSQYRFKVLLSPLLEGIIVESFSNPSPDIVKFIYKIIEKLKKYNKTVAFLIPVEIKYCFYGGFKLILSQIESMGTESNVYFYSRQNKKMDEICEASLEINNKKLQNTERYSIKIFLELLSSADFSFFLTSENLSIKKSQCLKSQCQNLKCAIDLNYSNQENIDNVLDFLIDNNYSNKIFKLKDINHEAINDIMFLIGTIIKAKEQDYKTISNTKYHPNFFEDIKKTNIQDLKNILASIFRGIVYPPSRDSIHRVPNSIDWHKNNPDKMNGYDLYRIDVCLVNRSGITNSGKKRLIIGKKNSITTVLIYTYEHDVSDELLKQRTNTILV